MLLLLLLQSINKIFRVETRLKRAREKFYDLFKIYYFILSSSNFFFFFCIYYLPERSGKLWKGEHCKRGQDTQQSRGKKTKRGFSATKASRDDSWVDSGDPDIRKETLRGLMTDWQGFRLDNKNSCSCN